uniref:Uncharacterized protein n=1 Tax=Lepeophtheirus salmonis TaxID=72036 RepID=A0A0K2UWW8_LEPSM
MVRKYAIWKFYCCKETKVIHFVNKD